MNTGDLIEVRTILPEFTDDHRGLRFREEWRTARFLEHTPKPYDPGACKVDYGNGPRKCSTALIREAPGARLEPRPQPDPEATNQEETDR